MCPVDPHRLALQMFEYNQEWEDRFDSLLRLLLDPANEAASEDWTGASWLQLGEEGGELAVWYAPCANQATAAISERDGTELLTTAPLFCTGLPSSVSITGGACCRTLP